MVSLAKGHFGLPNKEGNLLRNKKRLLVNCNVMLNTSISSKMIMNFLRNTLKTIFVVVWNVTKAFIKLHDITEIQNDLRGFENQSSGCLWSAILFNDT